MAIQDKTLSGAEHDWFATRSGEVSNAPLTQHKAAYFGSKGFGGVGKTLSQMEAEWLASLTGVNGSHNPPDQWREAVAGQGLTPSVKMDTNKFIFYTQVATSP